LPRPNKSDVTRNALSSAVEVEVRRQKGTVVNAFANAVAKNVGGRIMQMEGTMGQYRLHRLIVGGKRDWHADAPIL
jgi:hypothetical protein